MAVIYARCARSLRSRMCPPARVYGKRGGSPCVFIPVLVAPSLSPSPRTPLSQKRHHYSHWPIGGSTRSAINGPTRWWQSGKGARCAPLGLFTPTGLLINQLSRNVPPTRPGAGAEVARLRALTARECSLAARRVLVTALSSIRDAIIGFR